MIPEISIAFMGVSAAISIGLPVVLFFVWRKKYNLKFVPLLIGTVAFIIFAMILEQLLHAIVLQPNPDGSIALARNNPVLFVLYAIFAAGVFEETARFISFHLLKRKYKGLGTGLAYGIGHGGVEAVLIAGLAMISGIIMSVTINSGNTGLLGDDPVVIAQINTLAGANPVMFLASGFERILAVTIHISLSMLVWCSVKVKGKLWLYPAAIVLHALVNVAPALYQAGYIDNIWLIEGLILLPTTLIAYAAYKVCKLLPDDTNEDIPAAQEGNANIPAAQENNTEAATIPVEQEKDTAIPAAQEDKNNIYAMQEENNSIYAAQEENKD